MERVWCCELLLFIIIHKVPKYMLLYMYMYMYEFKKKNIK